MLERGLNECLYGVFVPLFLFVYSVHNLFSQESKDIRFQRRFYYNFGQLILILVYNSKC